jgi:uncharacterized protein YdeI (YjbR/CyaY-like superfamily)
MKEIACTDKKDLWNWLRKNHTQKESVWLVYYKPSLKLGNLDNKAIVDCCLCFGWIDSVVGKVDDRKTKVRISPRNPKSKWSRINKANVARLIKEKRMQPSGLAAVAHARETGTWDALNDVDNLVVPKDLGAELRRLNLNDAWEEISKSKKRMYLETLLNSKKEETRQKNIKKATDALGALKA